jgi:hypothetical protein
VNIRCSYNTTTTASLWKQRVHIVLKFCNLFINQTGRQTYDDAALNPEILLLEQPDLDARFLHRIESQEPVNF